MGWVREKREEKRGRTGITHLFKIQPKGLEPRHGCHVLPLVALDALYDHVALGELVGLLLLLGVGAGGLFGGVLCGALPGLDGEGGCRGFERLCGVCVLELSYWVGGVSRKVLRGGAR